MLLDQSKRSSFSHLPAIQLLKSHLPLITSKRCPAEFFLSSSKKLLKCSCFSIQLEIQASFTMLGFYDILLFPSKSPNHFWNEDNKIVHKQISHTIQNSLQTIKTGNRKRSIKLRDATEVREKPINEQLIMKRAADAISI